MSLKVNIKEKVGERSGEEQKLGRVEVGKSKSGKEKKREREKWESEKWGIP